MAKYFMLQLLLLPALLFARQKGLTAEQIVDASLAFCGGEQRIAGIQSGRISYLLVQPDQSTAIVQDQLKTGNKYVQSILSKTHSPQTTFFDGKKASRVNGPSVMHTTDVQAIEEIKLKTYHLTQYGYKKLKYKLLRLPHEKFQHFDCYVVAAQAANGYSTINFFDKTNFRLLMIVYPNENKSALLEYTFKDGVLFNSHIVNTFHNSKDQQILKLQSAEINTDISDTWFTCPYTDKVSIPDYIRKGKFASTNGAKTQFTRTGISMDYTDEQGKDILKRFVQWGVISPDTFGLIDEKALKSNDPSSYILVRIVSWDKNGYVCQWLTDKYTDTQDYRLVK